VCKSGKKNTVIGRDLQHPAPGLGLMNYEWQVCVFYYVEYPLLTVMVTQQQRSCCSHCHRFF